MKITQASKRAQVAIYPDSSVCTDLSRFGDTDNYKCVDEEVADEDSTYVYNNTLVQLFDLYGLPNQGLSGTINHIKICNRAKSQTLSPNEDNIYKAVISPDGTCDDSYLSSNKSLTTKYETYLSTWAKNPSNDLPFTWDDLNNMAIGVKCDSKLAETGEEDSITRRPASDFDVELTPVGDNPNHNCVDEAVADDMSTFVHCAYDPPNYDKQDVYNISSTALTDELINSVTITAKVRTYSTIYPNDEAEYYLICYTHGSPYSFTQGRFVHADGWQIISKVFTTNPWSGEAWTVAEVNALKIGIRIYERLTSGADHYFLCTQIYTDVDYKLVKSPEIRTTQTYAIVDYTPEDAECALNAPEEVSDNHTQNVKMMNLWNGERIVFGLSRSNWTLVLSGSEWYTGACDKILCIRDLGLNDEPVTLSGLNNVNWDGDWRILSWGWKIVGLKPEHIEWILELERYE